MGINTALFYIISVTQNHFQMVSEIVPLYTAVLPLKYGILGSFPQKRGTFSTILVNSPHLFNK